MALPLSLNGTAPVFSAIRAGLYKRAIIAAAIYLRSVTATPVAEVSLHCRRRRHLFMLLTGNSAACWLLQRNDLR